MASQFDTVVFWENINNNTPEGVQKYKYTKYTALARREEVYAVSSSGS